MPGLFFNMIALPQWKQIVFDNSLWIVIEKCLVGHMSLYSTYKTLENTLKEIRTRFNEIWSPNYMFLKKGKRLKIDPKAWTIVHGFDRFWTILKWPNFFLYFPEKTLENTLKEIKRHFSES